MKLKFEEDYELFIINPEYEDLEELKIKFTTEENGQLVLNANLLYLAQLKGLDDENSFDSYILYEKEDKLFTFREHENNATMSYLIEHEVSSVQDFLTMLDNLDDVFDNTFFKDALIQYNFATLNQEIPVNKPLHKKKKI